MTVEFGVWLFNRGDVIVMGNFGFIRILYGRLEGDRSHAERENDHDLTSCDYADSRSPLHTPPYATG